MSGKVEKFSWTTCRPGRSWRSGGRRARSSRRSASPRRTCCARSTPEARKGGRCVFLDADERVSSVVAGLPVPPRELRWGDPDEASGAAFHESSASRCRPARRWLHRFGPHDGQGAPVASSRSTAPTPPSWATSPTGAALGACHPPLRRRSRARGGWGADVGAPYIQWAQEHSRRRSGSSPRRRSRTRLRTRRLGFVYGISVMTHLDYLGTAGSSSCAAS